MAWNVRNVAAGNLLSALMTGAVLSWVWWGNSRTAGRSEVPYARAAYATGAGIGTLLGTVLGGL